MKSFPFDVHNTFKGADREVRPLSVFYLPKSTKIGIFPGTFEVVP